jgi:hypothetical protein
VADDPVVVEVVDEAVVDEAAVDEAAVDEAAVVDVVDPAVDPLAVDDPVVDADVMELRVVEPVLLDFEASVATAATVVVEGAEAAMAPHTPTKPAMLTPAAVSRARRAGWRRRVRRFGGDCRLGVDGMEEFSRSSLRTSCGQAWIPLGSRCGEDRPQGNDGWG